VIKGLRKDAQVGQMIFNDHVAGRLGALVGAPVPFIALIEIPQDLIDLNPNMNHFHAGAAHGSRSIPNVSERINDISYSQQPENRSRFAALAVFFGWLVAGDRQFLYQNEPPNLVYSVDHGHFFPGGPAWTTGSLASAGAATLADDLVASCALTKQELIGAVAALNASTAEQIAEAIAKPPGTWGVDLSERTELACYLWKRRAEISAAFNVLV
jgi:hypothetical protein